LRFDQTLFFVLQLDVGAKRVDAGAYAFFLQVGGLVIKGLRQIHSGIRGLDGSNIAERSNILRDDQQNYLLASGQARCSCGVSE